MCFEKKKKSGKASNLRLILQKVASLVSKGDQQFAQLSLTLIVGSIGMLDVARPSAVHREVRCSHFQHATQRHRVRKAGDSADTRVESDGLAG